jgi:hypothetical protein
MRMRKFVIICLLAAGCTTAPPPAEVEDYSGIYRSYVWEYNVLYSNATDAALYIGMCYNPWADEAQLWQSVHHIERALAKGPRLKQKIKFIRENFDVPTDEQLIKEWESSPCYPLFPEPLSQAAWETLMRRQLADARYMLRYKQRPK